MKFYLIDGTAYIYRAYHAISDLRNTEGFPTNAVFGFTSMLFKIMREMAHDGIAVVFDSPAPTFRHKLYRDYKANRPPPPDDLIIQIEPIKEIIKALNIPLFALPGYEADDIMATLAIGLYEKGGEVFIVSSDKDMLQIVNESIKIYDPFKNREIDSAYVKERYGVFPDRIADLLALTGDSSDNVPGVKGVGAKTAASLIGEFSSLDELIDNIDKISKPKLRSLISDNLENLELSKRLVILDKETPIKFHIDEFAVRAPEWKRLKELFLKFEFSSFLGMIPSEKGTSYRSEVVSTKEQLSNILSSGSFNELSLCIYGDVFRIYGAFPKGVAFAVNEETCYYIPVANNEPQSLTADEVTGIFRNFLSDNEMTLICHDLKNFLRYMEMERADIKGGVFDTMLASYLLNPNAGEHFFDSLSLNFLALKRDKPDKKGEEAFAEYVTESAVLLIRLKILLEKALDREGLTALYNDIEMPLVNILYDMERAGIKIDGEAFKKMSEDLHVLIESMKNRIYFAAGGEFNINSPKQLAEILFDRLGLTPIKKTKTGFSTDTSVLESLADKHSLPGEVLHFRTMTKLKNTYIDALPLLISSDTGRLHTLFNQEATATGRLSSSSPNLQNIPVKGEWGERIRRAFVAEGGNFLVSADYSQIELRILAHLSEDKRLMEAFKRDEDIHRLTAAEIFETTADKVTPDMRRVAKSVNFGIVYGISPFGLAEALKIKQSDAKRYIDIYFQKYEGIKAFMKGVVKETEKLGYSITITGRKRAIPGIKSKNKNQRSMAERLAINSPIQGSAADIIKKAMIQISNILKKERLRTMMLLQIHDELIFETPEEELQNVMDMVKKQMEDAVELLVPLKADIGFGKSWAEAH